MPVTPTSKRIGYVAIKKKASVGTAATPSGVGFYALPIQGTGGVKPERDRGDLNLTGATAAKSGQFVQRGRGGGSFTILAYPDPLGLLLYEAMGAQNLPTE